MTSPPHHRLDRRRAGYYRPAPPGIQETAATRAPTAPVGLFDSYADARRVLAIWLLVALGLLAGLGACRFGVPGAINGKVVVAGVPGYAPAADYAPVQEMGSASRGIPARPFMGPALYEMQDDITREIKDGVKHGLKP